MHTFPRRRLALALLALCPALWAADEAAPVKLPAPRKTGGMPLMQALNERKSTREFAPDKLPLQTLSDMLWAANGVNRPSGQRTAPSAVNVQNIDIYVTLPEGAYLYDAKANSLQPVAVGDIRKLAGDLSAASAAPTVDEYSGPVLFSDYAAAQLVSQLFVGQIGPTGGIGRHGVGLGDEAGVIRGPLKCQCARSPLHL